MSDVDQLFRDGLGDRKPDVPADLWQRIAANKASIPEGEALDQAFAGALGARQAAVPPNMWARIAAARRTTPYYRYAAALLLLLGLTTGYFVWDTAPTLDSSPLPDGRGTQVQNEVPVAQAASTELSTSNDRADAPLSPQSSSVDIGTVPPATPPANTAALASSSAPPIAQSAAAADAPVRAPRSATTARSVATLPADFLPVANLLPETGPVLVASEGGFRASGRHRLQGEVLLGAAYAHQRFGLQRPTAQEQRTLREVSEFPEVSYQLSARLRYRLGGPWRILTGLTYVELRNQFEYEAMLQGSPRLLRSNNRLRMLEVPLLASYELPGRRLRLSVNAGPVVHLSTGVSGQFLHPDSAQPRDLAADGQYRRSVGLGWTTSLTTTYTVGKQRGIQLLLEPFFKQYLGSFTAPEATLAEHYWMGGLQVGLRKQLR
ncbi:hypothetical protein LEM8419_03304 [Neolewinella maritima]|uniref:Outer membrane protein beta-barrel domain-containing protein n=1 Tax=Neolewinella maritima TaxID=1383882 RepID=A0ABN8FDL4_9BACT|nr:hypothetical protein [Neolewinella maritima]CAH1002422.1 hypothetical protein LEM8419_03304 [Neolewinella maritima]